MVLNVNEKQALNDLVSEIDVFISHFTSETTRERVTEEDRKAIENIMTYYKLEINDLRNPDQISAVFAIIDFIFEFNKQFFRPSCPNWNTYGYTHKEHNENIYNALTALRNLHFRILKEKFLSVESVIKEGETSLEKGPEKIIPDRLNSLRTELSKLCPEAIIDKNLKMAIGLVERNEFLASSLITTRLIAYLVSQINVPEEFKKANNECNAPLSNIDLIIKFFNERGIIPKGRKKDIPNLVKYGKDARDGVSHDICNFPTATECLSQLGSCFLLLSLIGRLKMADFFDNIYLYLVIDACEDLYPILKDISPEQRGWIQQANLQFKQENNGYWIGRYFTNHDFGAYSRLDWVSIRSERYQKELRDGVIREFISLVETNLGIKLSHDKVKNQVEKLFGKGSRQEYFGTDMDYINQT